ncbi:MAG: Do family serine endopeptidase [Pseudomonadota bacterium]
MRYLLLPLLLLGAGGAQAALPAAVDGQPLPSLAPILERVTPAVVNIHSRSVRENPRARDPIFRFFGAPRERVDQSLGSGVIVDAADGLILTNNHVIEGADDIQVTLHDGQTLEGQLVGTDPDTDVAVIRVDAEGLAELPLADGLPLRVGDFVVAVGNPFGLGQTVTSGIVSALGRKGLRGLNYQNFIQTDASINPGNSGGALINLRGELVGINTAIFSPSGGNVGIGFAIPADLANYVVSELLEYGLVRRGRLGVLIQDLDERLARALDLDQASGALITRVLPEAAAARDGLAAGDVVISINDQRITSADDLRNAEGLLRVGEEARLAYYRDGRLETARLTIEAAEPDRAYGATIHPELTGTVLANLDPEIAEQAGISGVVIAGVKRGSSAWDYGLRRGDVILGANRESIASLTELRERAQEDAELLLNVLRGRRSYLVLLEP